MTTIIRSNGSKWAGEQPDSIEVLLDVLSRHPLRREFEAYGNFVEHDPRNVRGEPIGQLLGVPGACASFFGNFHNLSHVFNIITDDADIIERLSAAIAANKQTPEYLRQPLPYLRDLLTIERKRFSETQGEVLLTYNGQRIDQFGDDIQLNGHNWQGRPDNYWHDVAKAWLAKRHAEQFALQAA